LPPLPFCRLKNRAGINRTSFSLHPFPAARPPAADARQEASSSSFTFPRIPSCIEPESNLPVAVLTEGQHLVRCKDSETVVEAAAMPLVAVTVTK
jgi:hypothetical protein